MMKSIELENIIYDLVNGNHSDAIRSIEKGCKTKPALYAIRVLYVYRELIGMGKERLACGFIRRIELESQK